MRFHSLLLVHTNLKQIKQHCSSAQCKYMYVSCCSLTDRKRSKPNDDDDRDDVEKMRIWCYSTRARWKRKEKIHTLKSTILVPIPKSILCTVVGQTGPTPDNQILEESKVLKEPDKCFSMLQYLLADAGYALGLYVCTQHPHPSLKRIISLI